MLRRLRIPLTLASLTALLVSLGYWKSNPSDELNAIRSKASTIDFFVINARAVQYQSNGKPQYEMTAEKLEHLQASDVTLLSKPDLVFFRPPATPWQARSEHGEMSPQGEEIELVEAVQIERPDGRRRPSILSTSRLSVFPEREYAQTQQAVMIEAANGVTTATGMKAYLNDGRIHLLSNIRGQHEVR